MKNKRPGIMSFWLDPSDNFLPIRISYKDKKSGKTYASFQKLSRKNKNSRCLPEMFWQ